MGHAHDHDHRAVDRRALSAALALILTFMVAEVVTGILASSLALLSDAAHMLTDAPALAMSAAAATAAGVGLAPGFGHADPTASLPVWSRMVAAAAGLLRASGRVFMEAAPGGVAPGEVGTARAA